jgi:hypothetical protein
LDGLSDTLGVLVNEAGDDAPDSLAELHEALAAAHAWPPVTLSATNSLLDRLVRSAAGLVADLGDVPESEGLWWAGELSRECQLMHNELLFLAPWAGSAAASDAVDSLPAIDAIPSLRALAGLEMALPSVLVTPGESSTTPGQASAPADLRDQIVLGSARAQARIAAIDGLVLQAGEFAEMRYDFLYDRKSRLLSIGYNVDERRRDAGYYDLLASEARAWPPADQCRWRPHPAVVERLNVRVPDATTGHADLQLHIAGSNHQGGGGAADRVWSAALCAMGDV